MPGAILSVLHVFTHGLPIKKAPRHKRYEQLAQDPKVESGSVGMEPCSLTREWTRDRFIQRL